jgi:hypothetical protein
MCGMSVRLAALAFKVWRDCITNMIHTAAFEWRRDNSAILHEIQVKLVYFEVELPKLELVLWKNMLDVSHKMETNCCQKKMRSDESDIQQQCRVTCGADVVIGHVMPFLIDIV